MLFFFFKQKTAYEMRISDWSSDVCSSDLDDFLDQILDRDETLGARIFVDYDRQMGALRAHAGEQVEHPHGLRDVERLADQINQRRRPPSFGKHRAHEIDRASCR